MHAFYATVIDRPHSAVVLIVQTSCDRISNVSMCATLVDWKRSFMLDISTQDYTERQVRIKDLEEMRGSARFSSETLRVRSFLEIS